MSYEQSNQDPGRPEPKCRDPRRAHGPLPRKGMRLGREGLTLGVGWKGETFGLGRKGPTPEAGWSWLIIAAWSTVAALVSVAVIAVLLPAPAMASHLFLSSLDGDQEVPPVESPGTGHAVTYLQGDLRRARTYLYVEGLVNEIVAAHVHLGPFGTDGPMLYDLGPFTDSTEVDFGPIAPAIQEAILAGNTYVNVHTNVWLDGEIRGQLTPTASHSLRGPMTGTQEVPPNESPATGVVDVCLWGDLSRLHVDINVAGLASPVTGAQVRRGLPGENGPVIFDLGVFAGAGTRADFAPTGEQIQDLLGGLCYLNVQTEQYPEGEIRGQIILDSTTDVPPLRMPETTVLIQPAPNPAVSGAWLDLRSGSLAGGQAALPGLPPGASYVIVDARGREVRRLGAGGGAVYWDGRDATDRAAPAGVYFIRLTGHGVQEAGLPGAKPGRLVLTR